MNEYGENKPYCYFHPKEMVIGICARCLKERLLVLASKQGHLSLTDSQRSFRALKRKPIITRPKVFALGSFIHLLESHQQRNKDHSDAEGSIASLEDSFISIKFEDDGQASWNKKKGNTTISKEITNEVTTMVEHSNNSRLMRWRKCIGSLLQLGRWKRSNKASPCQVGFGGKVEAGVKRRGWIRSLTRRTTTSD